MRLCFIISALLFCSGCASSIILKSDPPQAEVFFENPISNEKKSLGKTPIEMKTSAFKEIVGDSVSSGEFYMISLEKPEFQSAKFLVPATRFGTLISNLDVKLKPGKEAKEEQTARDILSHLFLAQKLALSKQYERAQTELDKILTEFPDFPRALSMRASIYFMQKNHVESLKWYDQALKYDPQMEDAVQMSAKIRALQSGGGSGPSKGKR